MGVLAIPQGLGQPAREGAALRGGLAQFPGEPGGDGCVIGRRAGIGPARQGPAQGQARGPLHLQFRQHCLQVLQLGTDRDIGMVLGRRADHGRSADIDVLDGVGGVRPAGNSLLEGVEVDVDEVDSANAVLGHGGGVGRSVAHAQQAAVHRRVQCLDPPVHHFREAGQVRDVLHRQARSGDGRPGAAGGDQLDPQPGQGLGRLDQAGLVRHRDQGSADVGAVRRGREVGCGRHGALRVGSEGRPRRAAL